MNFNTKYLPILIFSTLALGVVLGGMLNFPNTADYHVKNNSKSKLNKLIDFIDNEYVDDVNTDSIVDLTVDIFWRGSIHIPYIFRLVTTRK